MRTPRKIIYLIGLYCIISGIVFIAISVVSICAFACSFDFTGSSFTYMMYLLYFRRASCHESIDWEVFGASEEDLRNLPSELPDMPHTTAAVIRTFVFSIFYLVLNVIMIFAALRAMSGVTKTSINRHFLFWSYYSVLFFSLIAIIVMDFLSSAFYIVEFFLIFFNSNYVMTFMEIKNAEGFSQFFGSLSANIRSVPSMIFFLVTSKFLLILTMNIAVVYSLFTAAWKVCKDNQKQVLKIHELSKKKSSPVMSIKSIDSVHEMPPRFDTVLKSTEKRAAPEKPQTNPPEPPTRKNSEESQLGTFSTTLDISLTDTGSLERNQTFEEIEIPDLRLPRVSYEKTTTFQYQPGDNYDSKKRMSKTYF